VFDDGEHVDAGVGAEVIVGQARQVFELPRLLKAVALEDPLKQNVSLVSMLLAHSQIKEGKQL
jgi:hypothetical protein